MGNTAKNSDNEDAPGSIHLFLDDLERGRFTEGEIRRKLQIGECSLDTLAWKDGTSDWAPIPLPIWHGLPPLPRTTIPAVCPGNEQPAIQGLAQRLTLGWLLSVRAFVPWSVGAGFFGLVLVIIGGHNAGCAYRGAKLLRRAGADAMGFLGVNFPSCAMTFPIRAALSMQCLKVRDQALNNNSLI